MPNDDYSMTIKPVDNLHTIAGLTPAKRRQERKNSQRRPTDDESSSDKELDQTEGHNNDKDKQQDNKGDEHHIDYQA